MAKDQLDAKFQVLFQKHRETGTLQRKDDKNTIYAKQSILPAICFTGKR